MPADYAGAAALLPAFVWPWVLFALGFGITIGALAALTMHIARGDGPTKHELP